MDKTSEKYIERHLVEDMKIRCHGMCLKLSAEYVSGLPDRVCLFPKGQLAFVELKTTGKKPRRLQEVIHQRLRELGFRVEVIDSVEGVDKLMDEFSDIPF